MGRLEAKHWGLIAAFLAATATAMAGLDHWGDATKPAVVAGFIGQLAVLIGSLFAGAPPNPNHDPLDNPGRRVTDPTNRPAAGLLLVLAVPAMLAAAACAGNQAPQLSPVGRTAVQARAVIRAADAVVTGIDVAMTNKQLPAATGIKILQAIRQVGVQGQTLADALDVAALAQDATAKQKGLDAARAALAAIQATLVGAVSPITDPATRTQVDSLLKQLTDSVLLVQQLLAAV